MLFKFFEPITFHLIKFIHIPDFCATNIVLAYMKPFQELRRVTPSSLGSSFTHLNKHILSVPAFQTQC